MNSCRMTFKILVALLFALTLCVPTLAEKIGDPSGPTTLQQAQGIIDNDAALKNAPDNPGEDPAHPQIDDGYYPEDARFAPNHPGVFNPGVGRSGILTEGFETTMPPAGWSLITLNAITWDLATYNPHGGVQYASCAYDSLYTGPQDEWLVSPVIDLTSATTDLKIGFAWNMSYYWGVDPYDNYDAELWISIDGGATWPTKLWDETSEGVFGNFTWAEELISLSAYAGQANVKIAFRYTGYDGAQLCIDDVNINDDPPPTGRCCYDAGTCADITQAACTALGGSWDITKTCASDPCPTGPTGIDCSAPLPIDIDAAAFPIVVSGTTVDALDDYANTCLDYYDSGADRIYKITVAGSGRVPVRITMNPGTTTYTGFAIGDACPLALTGCYLVKTNYAASVYFIDTAFTGGNTYYMQVDTWSTPFDIASYTLTFGNPPNGRCCSNEGLTCADITEAACVALGGSWDGTKTCAADPCPTGPTGIDCGSAMPINLDLAALPLVLSGQTTVGKIDNYNATCLDSYDSGEDVIYKITVAGTGNQLYRITMNPGTTTYTGFAIGTTCPLAASGCTIVKTSSSAVVYTADVTLVGGTTYYMQVDTWASPLNIPDFSLTFAAPPPPPANDYCAAATVIGDVTDLAFSTLDATPDGPGGWITSKNIWYKYTSTCNGNVTVSLCGSAFDTKMRIYKKDGCPVIADSIAGNDDGCSGYPTGSTFASKVRFYTAPGVTYMIEVGGYGATTSGNGLLTVTCQLAPPRDNCADAVPVTLAPGVPVTFVGNNAGSTPDCSLISTYNQTWEAFTITQCMDVTLNYCGTAPAFTNALLNLVKGCTCTALTAAGAFNTTACGDGNVTITWAGLAAGTYYYPVIEGTGYSGAYTLHVVGVVPTSYCAATATTCDEFISSVTVGTISNASDCGLVSNYSDYTAYSTDMVQGVSYPITVSNGYPYTSDQCGIWIDWNNDFCFGADETVSVTGTPGSGPYTASISAPCDVPLGTKRLRIRVLYTGAVSPCGNASYGEVEDYTINLVAKPVVPPLATLSPNPQYAYAAHALNPIINTFYAGNFAGGYLASQINLATVKVNGETPTSATLGSYTGMYCGALKVQMPLASFIDNYGVLFDTTNTTYTITGTFADLTTFSIDGNVTLIGHASLTPAQYIVPPSVVVLPGDFDASGALDISDPVAMVAYIFAGGAAPQNVLMGDCDCSGSVDISDAVYMIAYIFGAGATPCHQ